MTALLRAVITGGGSGLGRALALDIARRGGRVVIADIDRDGADATASQVSDRGAEAHVIECDVRDRDAVHELAARAEERLGSVDLLANNAGVAVSGPFEQVSQEDWQWIMDINLWGVIYGCQAFYPRMKDRGRGFIINVASAAGLLCAPMMAPYNVTKSGVVALSETLHVEGKSFGVNVSVLCPTFFTTNIHRSGRSTMQQETGSWVEEAMRKSKIQAPDVARIVIDAVLAGHLYCVPMRNGRMMWRLKRLVPEIFHSLLGPRMLRRMEKQVLGK